MFKKTPLASAIGSITVASFLAVTGAALPAYAEEADEEAMEEVVVTGSRIKRSTNTQSQEILTITAEDMQMSGDISIAEALRSSTLNSLGSFRESSGSSAQSNAIMNLRGMGAGRTLVLINGRRITGSPSLGGGGTVNLNMIPFSAVDRMEIIADGGSAVYGSDAVAGVVNIVMKKDYEGMKISYRYGDRSRDEGEEGSFSILSGVKSDRGSITFALEFDERKPIFDKDRDFTKARWGDYDGDGYIQGGQETIGVSSYGYRLVNPGYVVGSTFDPNDESTWYYHPGANCTETNGFAGVMRSGVDGGFYCGYAYALVSANRAGMQRINSYVSAEYEVTDTIDAHVDLLIARNESFGRYAPPAASGPPIPGDARNSIGATWGYFRWTDIGLRDNVVDDNLIDINMGLSGEFGDGNTWDFNYTSSDYTSSSVGNYYLSYAGFEYNVNYNITDFDTFVNNLKATTVNNDRQQLQKISLGAQFDMFDMPAGAATAYVGYEYYEVDYSALVDAQSEAGLIGGSAGNSAEGYRDVTAYYAEAIFPVTDWAEIDVAVRVDDYSDFGSATSPRIGATFSIPGVDGLTVKASWGQGFRAPDLSDLYGATAFSAEDAYDYYYCRINSIAVCNEQQFDTFIGSNPELDAETSESISLGVSYVFMDSWTATVNYMNLTLEDAIEYTSAQDQLNVDDASNGGNPNVVRNSSTGFVESIAAGYQNGTTEFEREAMDFAVQGSVDTSFGTWNMRYNATYFLNYEVETIYGTGELRDAVGSLGFPEWRTNVLVTWSMEEFSATMNYDYIGEHAGGSESYDGWDTINLSASYDVGKFGVVTVGANNVTDEDPLLDKLGDFTEEYLYDHTGRVVYFKYSYEM